MQMQTYEQRILIPEEGLFLVNHTAKTISEKVFLGIHADASEWTEITAEEKEALKTQWEAEVNAEVTE